METRDLIFKDVRMPCDVCHETTTFAWDARALDWQCRSCRTLCRRGEPDGPGCGLYAALVAVLATAVALAFV